MTPKQPSPPSLSTLEGVVQAKQPRSNATFEALMREGRNALQSGGIEEMTIGKIAAAAGISVGTFYGRFNSKEALFQAVQETVIAEIEAGLMMMLEHLDAQQAGAYEFAQALAEFAVGVFRHNEGVYRAAFKHSSAQPGIWTPFKRLGLSASSEIAVRFMPRLRAAGLAPTELDIRTAMQFLNSFLVNAVINDPGPLHLRDANLAEHMAKFLCQFLGIQAPQRSTRTRKTKAT